MNSLIEKSKKTKEAIYNILFIAIGSLLILTLTFVVFGFDIERISIFNIGFSVAIPIYFKIGGSSIERVECLNSKEIIEIENIIENEKQDIYQKRETEYIERSIKYLNKELILEYKLYKLDKKLDRIKNDKKKNILRNKRNVLIDLLGKIKEQDFKSYDSLENDEATLKIIRVNSLKFKKITWNNLFNNKALKKGYDGIKKTSMSLSRNLLMHTFGTIILMFFLGTIMSGIVTENVSFGAENLLLFIVYITMAMFYYNQGKRIMNRTILIDYLSLLENRKYYIEKLRKYTEVLKSVK